MSIPTVSLSKLRRETRTRIGYVHCDDLTGESVWVDVLMDVLLSARNTPTSPVRGVLTFEGDRGGVLGDAIRWKLEMES